MSCEWRANIDRYLDDELPSAAAAELEAHIRECPDCAADALSRLQLKRLTHQAGQKFVSRPEFRLKIERSIGAAKRPPGRRRIWSLAAASAFCLIVVSTALWFYRSRGSETMSELADLHVSALASANPVDVVSTDRHTVKPWFQGKLPFSFNLPELDGSPFRLLGGRVTYLRQSPGAHLLFQIREHRVSVFVFQDRPESGADSDASFRRRPAFNFDTWTEGGLRYFVVGDIDRVDLQALGELIKRAGKI